MQGCNLGPEGLDPRGITVQQTKLENTIGSVKVIILIKGYNAQQNPKVSKLFIRLI